MMTTRLGKLLEGVAGIDPAVLGDKNLARAVGERMSARKLADEGEYFDMVRSSACELESLIEAVVVSETSFFRDKGPFTFLEQHVRSELIPGRRAGALRILSAPCSSGEEPYSVAMALRGAGLKPDDYRIDALDISRALLRRAEHAVYTRHSFRGVPESFRDRFFVPLGHEYLLKDEIRQGVRFIHGNLLDDRALAGKRLYDIIFCRNLLIYLSAQARARVVNTIERLMAPNGLLFVGHAETSCFPSNRFTPLHHRGAFGFRRAGACAASGRVSRPPQPPAPLPVPTSPQTSREKRQHPATGPDTFKPRHSIGEARRLADLGRLPEAEAMCDQLLRDDGPNADTYCLLGTVLHGQGDLRRAEECFTRAIYLDERCYDAAVYLSLIREYRGDSAGAEVLRRRAARIQTQMRSL